MDILASTIKKLQDEYGKQMIIDTKDDQQSVEIIPTGSLTLNNVLGIGGIPKGRITEIFGNESCGKTTIALQTVAQCQKMGGRCAYIDLEHALDTNYCKKIGINLKELLIIHPENAEQTFSIIEALVKTDELDLLVVDSVAALVPKAELEGEFDDQTIGLNARIMSKGLRIIQSLLEKKSTGIIFINQIREKIGVMYGNNETTTGGRALRFYASIRLELRRSELLKSGDGVIGIAVAAKTIKNKLAPPMQRGIVNIYFDSGFDPNSEIINFAIEKGIIEKRGCWFYFDDAKIAQGYDGTKAQLLENEEMFNKIKEKVLKL